MQLTSLITLTLFSCTLSIAIKDHDASEINPYYRSKDSSTETNGTSKEIIENSTTSNSSSTSGNIVDEKNVSGLEKIEESREKWSRVLRTGRSETRDEIAEYLRKSLGHKSEIGGSDNSRRNSGRERNGANRKDKSNSASNSTEHERKEAENGIVTRNGSYEFESIGIEFPKRNVPQQMASNFSEFAHNENEEDYSKSENRGNNETKSEIVKIKIETREEPDEEDIVEAANYGLQAMHDLYYVKEPKLHSMGLYLRKDDPAGFVAAFNQQTEEARALSKYGFAVLQGTAMFMRKFPDAPKELILSRRSQRNPLQLQCPNRGIPVCPTASLRYRTSDGSCNNLKNLWWGSAMSTMERFLPAVYHDTIQSIRRSKKTGEPLPSPRDVSAILHEDRDVPLASVTHMLMQWGQFIDHDLTATGQSRGFNGTVPQCCLNAGAGFQPAEFMHPECLPIAVNLQDSFFGPLGVRCLEFVRSGAAPREDCKFGPREQLTQVTSYLDASTVYSSNAFQTDSLRLFRNGLLQYGRIQSRKPVLPRQESDLCNRGSISTSCFRAGDGRLSEQPALTSLHVLFLRLHNRIATKLAALNFHWSDEKLFQETRRIVGAVVQHITYREFLPIVLGSEVMKIFDLEVLRKGYYEGYDPKVNPTIANGFSTAAYRFGHSLVQHSFVRFDSHHKPLFNNVSIHDEFSNPVNLESPGSVDRLLLGLVNQPSQRRDEFITDELTNHLFQTPRFPFGMDLASLNIQRGRDHGIPPYVQWREPCGLSPIRNFEDLQRVMSPNAVRKFRLLYSSVEDIDLYPAGLAENSVSGGLVGPTFACIIAQQFGNLRRGDRFWYENPGPESGFTPGQLQQIRRVTLAQVLCTTMDQIESIQPFTFLLPDSLRNQRASCEDPSIGQLNLDFWAERSPEFRSNEDTMGKANRRPSSQPNRTTPRPQSKLPGSAKINTGGKHHEKLIPLRQKPIKASIHQNNKLVFKRPLGPPDNVTIVVQNNAVNSPLFVNDAIYGSNIRISPSTGQRQPTSTPGPTYGFATQPPIQVPQGIPVYAPPAQPIPTGIPAFAFFHNARPYVPHAFHDPSNPNPLTQGYQSQRYGQSDVIFERYPLSTPRPTLYTYYSNVQQPTTQWPSQQGEAYLVKYRPQDYTQFTAQSSVQSPGSSYGQVPPIPPTTSWSTLEPNYQAHDQPPVYKLPYNAPGKPQSHPTGPNRGQSWPKLPDQYGSGQQQDDPGSWPSQTYQTRPNARPLDQQSNPESWNAQDYQNKRIDISHSQNDHNSWNNNAAYQAGEDRRPSTQPTNDFPTPRPSYQTQKRPVQADPDGWSTLPSHKKESDTRPSGYRNPGILANAPVYDVPSTSKIRPISNEPSPTYQTSSSPTDFISSNDPASYGARDSVQVATSPKPNYSEFIETPAYHKATPSSSIPWSTSPRPSVTTLSYQRPTINPVHHGEVTIQTYSSSPIGRPGAPENESSKRMSSVPGSTQADKISGNSPPYRGSTQVESDQGYSHKADGYPKPTKVYSVTIVNDEVGEDDKPAYPRDEAASKIREVPRPLVSQVKNNRSNTRRPGQFYYEKNVLRRYPEAREENGSREIAEERHKVIEEDEESDDTIIEDSETSYHIGNEYETQHNATGKDYNEMSHYSVSNADGNEENDHLDYDLDGAFSEEIQMSTSPDRTRQWVNLQEDWEMSSVPEMPRIAGSEGIADAKELPRPIKFRNRAS